MNALLREFGELLVRNAFLDDFKGRCRSDSEMASLKVRVTALLLDINNDDTSESKETKESTKTKKIKKITEDETTKETTETEKTRETTEVEETKDMKEIRRLKAAAGDPLPNLLAYTIAQLSYDCTMTKKTRVFDGFYIPGRPRDPKVEKKDMTQDRAFDVLRGFLVEEVLIPGTMKSILPPLPINSAEQKGAAATEKDGDEDAKETVGKEHQLHGRHLHRHRVYRLKCPRHHQMAYRSRRRLAISSCQHSHHRPLMKQAKTRSCNRMHTRLDKRCVRKTKVYLNTPLRVELGKQLICKSPISTFRLFFHKSLQSRRPKAKHPWGSVKL